MTNGLLLMIYEISYGTYHLDFVLQNPYISLSQVKAGHVYEKMPQNGFLLAIESMWIKIKIEQFLWLLFHSW